MAVFFLALFFMISAGQGNELKAGAACVDITPSGTVYLAGWTPYRVSKGIETPLKVNIIALESVDARGKQTDTAFILAFDLISIRVGLMAPLRQALAKECPELNLDKFLFCGTHTHCAPLVSDQQMTKTEGIMHPTEYVAEIVPKVVAGVKRAWSTRQKASFSFGLGEAVVARTRVTRYTDGTSKMYGKTNQDNFDSPESPEDHEVGCMFFWDTKGKPIAMLINVACPSQGNERYSNCLLSSDYWGRVREKVAEKYGDSVVVAGLCGAAGDMSPHQMIHIAARARMDKLRGFIPTQEAARRITQAIDYVYPLAFSDRKDDVMLLHRHAVITVPKRVPTKAEYDEAVSSLAKLKVKASTAGNGFRRVISRYENLKTTPVPTFKTPINVLRIGDTVLCTNQFELYSAYGLRIKARSRAVQTFVVQLTNGSANFDVTKPNGLSAEEQWGSAGTYLPTKRGTEGGSYGGLVQTNLVGPSGGDVLVDETLKIVNELW